MLAMRQVLGVGANSGAKRSALKGLRVREEAGRGSNRTVGGRGSHGTWEDRRRAREPPRERADSVPHTPGGATPPFKSGCWMLVKNHFFSKCYNRAVTFYFLFFLRVLIFQRYTLKGLR